MGKWGERREREREREGHTQRDTSQTGGMVDAFTERRHTSFRTSKNFLMFKLPAGFRDLFEPVLCTSIGQFTVKRDLNETHQVDLILNTLNKYLFHSGNDDAATSSWEALVAIGNRAWPGNRIRKTQPRTFIKVLLRLYHI